MPTNRIFRKRGGKKEKWKKNRRTFSQSNTRNFPEL